MAVFLCAKVCRENATHLIGARQNAVSFTDPAPGREACPVPVGTAARRFCGTVPLLSNPPAWILWQVCPSAFRRSVGRFPAPCLQGDCLAAIFQFFQIPACQRHGGSVPGCGQLAQTVPAFPAFFFTFASCLWMDLYWLYCSHISPSVPVRMAIRRSA